MIEELLWVELVTVGFEWLFLVKLMHKRLFQRCEQWVNDDDLFLDLFDGEELGQVSLCISDVAHGSEGKANDTNEDVYKVFGHCKQDCLEK